MRPPTARGIQAQLLVTFNLVVMGVWAQHGSFANTKFELSPELPVEEPASNLDAKPDVVVKSTVPPPSLPLPPSTAHTQRPVILTSSIPTTPISTRPPQTLPTLPPTSLPVYTRPTETPLPVVAAPSAIAKPSPKPSFGVSPKSTSGSRILEGPSKTQPISVNRAEQWFREDYDISACPRDRRRISQTLKGKFPAKLLAEGKEAILAELLATQIVECQKKQEQDHWNAVEKYVDSITHVSPTEQEECRTGLIQEQISCLNIVSYACQFMQPSFTFRLIPTRIIVQEARLAEDGTEKCRKFLEESRRV